MADSRWNVKRGLNRLFVVSAACWYIVAGFILWPKWAAAVRVPTSSYVPNAPPQSRGWKLLDEPNGSSHVKRREPDELDQLIAEIKRTPPRPVEITSAFLFAPPAIYVLAIALVWVARGFQIEPRR